MKKGDIVRWTNPDAPDVGVVVDVVWHGACSALVHIMWTHPYEYSGLYPYNAKFLEVMDESGDKRNATQ